MKAVGWKFGRWLDTVYMQRRLGEGDSKPPDRKLRERGAPSCFLHGRA